MITGKWTWGETLTSGLQMKEEKNILILLQNMDSMRFLLKVSSGFTGLFPGDTVTTSYTKTTPDFDLDEIQNYAKSKGVSLQAYHETSASTLITWLKLMMHMLL